MTAQDHAHVGVDGECLTEKGRATFLEFLRDSFPLCRDGKGLTLAQIMAAWGDDHRYFALPFASDGGFHAIGQLVADELRDGCDLQIATPARIDQHNFRFPLRLSDQLAAADGAFRGETPKIDYRVDGLLPVGSVCMLVGDSYTMKSWAAMSIALAVQRGDKWLGRYATKRGRVLFIDFEMGERAVEMRLRKLGSDGAGFARLSYPKQWHNGVQMPLHVTDRHLWTEVEKTQADLIIVDSLSRGSGMTVDEKDSRFAMPLMLAGEFGQRTGATVVFIHHTTKEGSRRAKKDAIRGTSAIFGALDACLYFSRATPSDTDEPRAVVETIKQRNDTEAAPFGIQLAASGLVLFDRPKRGRPSKSDGGNVETDIRAHLEDKGDDAAEGIAKALGKRESAIREVLVAMVAAGSVVAVTAKGRGRSRRYRLATDA